MGNTATSRRVPLEKVFLFPPSPSPHSLHLLLQTSTAAFSGPTSSPLTPTSHAFEGNLSTTASSSHQAYVFSRILSLHWKPEQSHLLVWRSTFVLLIYALAPFHRRVSPFLWPVLERTPTSRNRLEPIHHLPWSTIDSEFRSRIASQ